MRARLVTINTAKEDEPYLHRLDLLATGLARLQPDIVLLQETVNTPDNRYNTTRTLAAALDLTAIEAPARCKPRRIAGEIIVAPAGLGLLSRLPVLDSDRMPLPSDPADGERIALFVRIDTSAGEVLIINTHLTYLRNGAGIRRRQLETIFGHPWLRRPWAAAVLGGDLNTDLPELPELLAAVSPPWSLCDAYVAGGGAEPRVTMPAYWASSRDRCLDYLLAIEGQGPHPRWSDAAVVLDQPDATGLRPSDHRGVTATMELPDRERPEPR